MGRFLWSIVLSIQSFLLYSLFSLMVINSLPNSVPSTHHECHEDESYALLQFKESFVISKHASYDPYSYPKTASWMPTTDCCSSWDGIQCNDLTSHVIGIYLRSSQLFGSIDANSTLFSLTHLQSLDLSDNDFNGSQISSRIGELSQIRYLNLSHCWESTFSGEVPSEISHLSNLLSLDLRSYYVSFPNDPISHLWLQISTLRNLIQNSTGLVELRLSYVKISSPAPSILTNLTSLKKLTLYHCELHSEFPIDIFHLPNLRNLNLGSNKNLRGMLPDFNSSALISILVLEFTSFYGTLPTSLGNLTSLNVFEASLCNFYRSIPSSLGNLNQLEYLDLSFNSLQGKLELDMLLKLKVLNNLDFSRNKLSLFIGKSSSNVTLPPIQGLGLSSCNLSGEIPPWIMNLTTLSYLELSDNNFHGEIPHTLFKLKNLASLDLASNLLEGQLEFDMFMELKMLSFLALSFNRLSLLEGKSHSNITASRIQILSIRSCNLVGFPNFLQQLEELVGLYISDNDLKSDIPSWMWRKTSLVGLFVSHSSLTGEISSSICNLKSLKVLDLSYNKLSGMIPPCLGSFSPSLQVLMLRGNNLVGRIPQTYMIGSVLHVIDFSYNNLKGQLPKALVNCKMLEYLDVTHNQINDSFPFWLGSLPELKVIALRQNRFYGAIKCPRKCTFPKLHIIDLSQNDFCGNLTSDTIRNWKSMTISNMNQLRYDDSKFFYGVTGGFDNFSYSFSMSSKGVFMDYEDIQQSHFMLITIDLSSNRISGEIPEAIGDMKSLILLNLSNNMFTGSIPLSLGKLSNLEELDLSVNNLSGKIPQELTELTFLEFFNVSFNNLSGPVPENKQFSTFQENSFEGNQRLCGIQLIKKCEDHARPSPPQSDGEQDSEESLFAFDWKIVLIGYGGGLVAGLVLGSTFSPDILQWMKRFF